IWVADHGDGTLTRVDPLAGDFIDTIHVGDGPAALSADRRNVWVADDLDSTISRIDPLRDAVTSVSPTNGTPNGVATWGRATFVGTGSDGGMSRLGGSNEPVARLAGHGQRVAPLGSTSDGLWVGIRAGGTAHRGGSLRVVTSSPTRPLDPALDDEYTPLQVLGLTNDGLVTLNHAAGAVGTHLVPDLAVALPRPSQSGTTYVFRLRSSINYSTGGRVTASDVRHTFER